MMTATLDPVLEQYIAQKVRSGAYHSASDLISGAVAMLQAQENENPKRLEALRAKVTEAIVAIESGQKAAWDVDALKARLLEGLGNAR